MSESPVRKLLGRASGALLVRALPVIYGASIVFFIIRQLPLDEYGKYGIAFAFINIFGASWRGLWLIPYMTWAARGERASVIAPAFWLSYAFALLGAALSFVILPMMNAGGSLCVISALIFLVLVPRELACVTANAEGKIWLYFLFDSLYFIGSLAGFWILSLYSELNTAETALWVNFVSILCSAIVGLITYPFILKPGRGGDWKGLFNFGRWIGIQSVSEITMQQGDTLLAGFFFEPAKLAPYFASKTLFRLYTLFSQAANLLVLPVASRLSADGRISFLVKRVNQALGAVWTILIPVNLLLWFYADDIFPLLLGEKYIAAIPYFKILILASFFEPIYSILANTLVGAGKPRETAVITGSIVAGGTVMLAAVLSWIGLSAVPYVIVGIYALLAFYMMKLARQTLNAKLNPVKGIMDNGSHLWKKFRHQ